MTNPFYTITMKNYTLPFTLFVFLLSACGSTSLTSPSISSSLTPSSSISESLSEITSSQSSSSSVMMGNLNTKWTVALGNVTPTSYTQLTLSVPSQLASKGVTEVIQVNDLETSLLYGYAFEVLVDGFSGPIRFRVGITETSFTGIQIVSDSEHTGFGKVILNALKNNLAGVNKNYDALLTMLAQKNATRSGKSGTYDGVIPALEAIILHSFA